MTASNLLFTAHHVAYNPLHPGSNTVDEKNVVTSHNWFDEWEGSSQFDDWYLRLRLKGLGLDPWATTVSHGVLELYVDRWDFLGVEDYSPQEKDVYLISTESRLYDDNWQIPAWEAIGPGLFFDFQVPGEESGLPRGEVAADMDAKLLQVNLRVGWENDVPAEEVRLVSNDGWIREFPASFQQQEQMWDGSIHNYVWDVRGNWDDRDGSSGGGLFTERRRIPHFIGVHAGMSGDTRLSEDWHEDNKLELDDGSSSSWATALTEKMSEDRREHRANHGYPHRSNSEDCVAGDSSSCFDECVKHCAGAGSGTALCDPASGNSCWDHFEEELPTYRQVVHTGCVGKGCPSGGGDAGSRPPPVRDPETTTTLNCQNNGLATLDPDFDPEAVHGLGLLGAPTGYELLGDNIGLGSFGVICGPFSGREWSMNWDFVSAESRLQSQASDQLKHVTSTIFTEGRSLSHMLTSWARVYDDRKENGHAIQSVSPLPFQMCPPGFVMRGFDVAVNGEDEYIVGITAVRCLDVRQEKDETCLDPKDPGFEDYPCRVPTFTVVQDGYRRPIVDPYSSPISGTSALERDISQYLGDPTGGSFNVFPLICPSDQRHVVGAVTSADRHSPTQFIELLCQDYH